jgi:hypothetical protein
MPPVVASNAYLVVVTSWSARRDALLAAAALDAALRELGAEGVEIVAASPGRVDGSAAGDVGASGPGDPRLAIDLAALGFDPDLLAHATLDSALVETAELIFCLADADLERLLAMGAGRAYTLAGYVGREGEAAVADRLVASGEERARQVVDLARQAAHQIVHELETDPARPAGTGR